ncbi:hypothetical protein TNCV_334381 [Trichonephila clavipes]|nr:hypothetical protein TNCV_334381 [Trichonephila clavipes]
MQDVQIKVNDWVLVKTHPLSSASQKVVAKFKPKSEGPYRVQEVKRNHVVVWKAGKRLTVDVDLVRHYHMKSDEKVIRTNSFKSNSSRYKSSIFEVRRRHNKEGQFNPEEAENNSTATKPRSKECQATGVPEKEEIISRFARRGSPGEDRRSEQSKIPVP